MQLSRTEEPIDTLWTVNVVDTSTAGTSTKTAWSALYSAAFKPVKATKTPIRTPKIMLGTSGVQAVLLASEATEFGVFL